MSKNNLIIDEKYCINVYLDTNILVDYIEKSYPILNESIDFLAHCPFVRLRSSHYVLFEFSEVRKIGLFWEKADPTKMNRLECVKNNIKKNWSYNGKQYKDFKDDITNQVVKELEYIRDNLEIIFDDHVLHEGLVYPTNSLCLETKISKEDCLIMVSCMHPKYDDKLDHCILLTRDEQYYKAYIDNKNEVDMVFRNNNLNIPILLRTEDLKDNNNGRQYNLYAKEACTDIKNFWTGLIMETLIFIHQEQYLGKTYKYNGTSETVKKSIFFEMDNANKGLKETESLYFVFGDLSNQKIVQGPFEFWNTKKIDVFPYCNPNFPKYSFLTQGMDDMSLMKLREKGNLVFYYNLDE